jgi:hypothetical protein
MKKIYVTLTILSFLLIPLLYAQTANVAGDWELTSQSPRGGERTSALHFDQDGEKIKVTMEGFRGAEMTGEGTVQGNNIQWTVTISTPNGEITLTYKGTVEGDAMSGTVEMGDRGSREWTAKKK